MRKICATVLVLLASLLAAQQLSAGQRTDVKDKQPLTRTLTGHVTNRQGKPIPGAVVYLTNTRTMQVKTYIVGDDGSYRFPALSPNVDYQIYAQTDTKRSDTKTLSSFDTRPDAVINLKIETK